MDKNGWMFAILSRKSYWILIKVYNNIAYILHQNNTKATIYKNTIPPQYL